MRDVIGAPSLPQKKDGPTVRVTRFVAAGPICWAGKACASMATSSPCLRCGEVLPIVGTLAYPARAITHMKGRPSYKPTFFDRHGPAGEQQLKAFGMAMM